MARWVPFWPNTAGESGIVINNLYIAELAICFLILLLVVGLMLTFGIRYRRGSAASRASPIKKTWHWEIGWTAASLVGFLVLFVWGAAIYIWLYQPPRGDIEIYVVGKQWMWKIQHPGGQREINALHIPLGKTIRLVLASQDVVHSFFIPAFRLKHDAVPGSYQTLWLKPTKLGHFRLECSEFCGTQHAHMAGEVIVLTPQHYAQWLADQGAAGSLAEQGLALFRHYGCSGCHAAASSVHAPDLAGLYGSLVHLQDGSTVRADEAYIRDAVLLPKRKVVAGYKPIMPSFEGQIGEDDLMKIIAYIQSLSNGKEQNGNARR
ncbi:MAG: cytochrome c oxidase subunit II [Thiohalocapsa sp.]